MLKIDASIICVILFRFPKLLSILFLILHYYLLVMSNNK